MPGITRIQIDSDWRAAENWRLKLAEDHAPAADKVLRGAFLEIGIDLAPNSKIEHVTRDEAKARYDWSEGIDVILKSSNGARMTLQEKFLTFDRSTVTFEETKSSGAPGAWYYCTAQYYFVGYTRQYCYWDRATDTQLMYPNPVIAFQDWMLLDFPAMRRADAAGTIPWFYNRNRRDRRRADFRYADFDVMPKTCILARYAPPPLPSPVIADSELVRTDKQIKLDMLKAKWSEKLRV